MPGMRPIPMAHPALADHAAQALQTHARKIA
jgi:hypothetical protein